MKVRNGTLLAFLTLSWAGCASDIEAYQLYSSGRVGCSPDAIAISDVERRVRLGRVARTWIATCSGKQYRCTYLSTNPPDISCAPKAD